MILNYVDRQTKSLKQTVAVRCPFLNQKSTGVKNRYLTVAVGQKAATEKNNVKFSNFYVKQQWYYGKVYK